MALGLDCHAVGTWGNLRQSCFCRLALRGSGVQHAHKINKQSLSSGRSGGSESRGGEMNNDNKM